VNKPIATFDVTIISEDGEVLLEVKGFAVTLCLGIGINLFTALIGTKVIFDLMNQRHKVEQLSI